MNTEDEDRLRRSVTIQGANGTRLARQRAERELIAATESLSTLPMRNFAKRLIAYETSGNMSSGTRTPAVPAAFPVCEKLRPHLANLMGAAGFRALLARALTRAEAELPSLRAMQVKEDGSLAALDSPEVRADPDELATGSVVLVAQLLGLLVAFIGEKLMLQIICDVWPKLPPNDLSLFSER